VPSSHQSSTKLENDRCGDERGGPHLQITNLSSRQGMQNVSEGPQQNRAGKKGKVGTNASKRAHKFTSLSC